MSKIQNNIDVIFCLGYGVTRFFFIENMTWLSQFEKLFGTFL